MYVIRIIILLQVLYYSNKGNNYKRVKCTMFTCNNRKLFVKILILLERIDPLLKQQDRRVEKILGTKL